MKPKVIYIVSKVSKAVAFEWIVEELQDRIDFEFILIHDNFETDLARFLRARAIGLKQFPMGSKWQLPLLWWRLFSHLVKSKPNAVHTHLFEASLLGLSAAKLAGIKNRIYTRHHSSYHHEFFPKAIKYDRWINALATRIVAISSNVKNVLLDKEKVSPDKLVLIEHGFRLENFSNRNPNELHHLREKYSIPEGKFVVGVVSRYIEWKGVEYAVRGFRAFLDQCPDAYLLLANAGGPHERLIRKELDQLPKSSYTEIPFEPNLYGLYGLFDAFVHVPINPEIEAFGQTYVEALAAGVPSIFTKSGIAQDFIVSEENAFVVPFKDSTAISHGLIRLYKEGELNLKRIEKGKISVKRFELNQMTEALNTLYLNAHQAQV